MTIVDTLKDENQKEPFKSICPISHTPVMRKDGQLVISQANLLYEWLMKVEPSTGALLYHESQDLHIRVLHRYFFKDMRNVTS